MRGSRPSTQQREEAIRLLRLDFSVYEIAATTGVTVVTLYAWARKLQIPLSVRRSSPGREFKALTETSPQLLIRFLENVEFLTNGCWVWVGGRTDKGYGRLVALGEYSAHRVSYRIFKGAIPEGLHLDHLCSRPSCVNPFHLEAVELAENNRRTVERGRGRKRMTSLEYGEWMVAV